MTAGIWGSVLLALAPALTVFQVPVSPRVVLASSERVFLSLVDKLQVDRWAFSDVASVLLYKVCFPLPR